METPENELQTLRDKLAQSEKELKSLKRQVEDLEDEKTIAEESVTKNKKLADEMLKKQKDEFNKLFGDMQHAQLERQRLQEENAHLKAVNEQRKKAIEFVSYILNAPAADRTERSSRQLTLVDQMAAFIKEDFVPLLRENNITANLDRADFERFMANQKKTWITGKTAVAFIGEFSSGKTSIVNRLLTAGNPDATLMKVSTKASTAIPTYISSTSSNSFATYSFISKDESRKVLESRMVEEMSKETLDEVRGMDQLINYVVREEANSFLSGISILDTPGFSSNDAKDKERTLEVVNECDALFWVIDVNNGTINQSSLSVIREKLEKPLYIIVNKVDTKSSNEVNEVIHTISETLRSKGVEYKQILRFSKLEDIDQLITMIRSIRKTGQAEDYFRRVQGQLNILDGNLRSKYNQTRSQAQEQMEKLQLEMQKDADAIDNLEDRIIEYGNRLINMPQEKGTWFGLGDNEHVMTDVQYRNFISLIHSIADPNLPNSLLSQLFSRIGSFVDHAYDLGAASKDAANKIGEIVKKGTRVKEHKEQFDKLLNGLAKSGQTKQTNYQDSGKSQEEIDYERRLRDYQNRYNG
jgi:putative atp /gtp binding protein